MPGWEVLTHLPGGEALGLSEEQEKRVFTSGGSPCKQEELREPVNARFLLVKEERGDLSPALASRKDAVSITRMFFFLLPLPPPDPALLVPQVTPLQVLASSLGWDTSVYLSSSLCRRSSTLTSS